MLKKIIKIKNVGRFKNFNVTGDQELRKNTFIYGPNGCGKTTFCNILRSLHTNDPAHILGRKTLRKTLDEAGEPVIELLLNDRRTRFDGMEWKTTNKPEIIIFGDSFIAENVHSGEVVGIEHRRNLYRVIIGNDGVELAAKENELAKKSRDKTGEITKAEKAIQSHMPAGKKLNAFISLPETADIDRKIKTKERDVEALRANKALRERPALSEFEIPVLLENFTGLLTRTIDDIAKDAEQKLSEHLATHDMTASNGNWIADGLKHAADTCPFCGQNIRGLPLIAAFQAIFSERYKALSGEIKAMKKRVEQDMGDAALTRLDTVAARNKGDVEFWQKYCCGIEGSGLAMPAGAVEAIRALATEAIRLLDCKAAMPLEPITPDAGFTAARDAYNCAAAAIEGVNRNIRAANTSIMEKKEATDTGNLKAAEAELTDLKTIQTRHSREVANLCNSYTKLREEKKNIETLKETVRKELDSHTNKVVQPYEKSINDSLAAFNAGFAISKTKHTYSGGIATSSYQLVINDVPVDLGDSKTPVNRPSFKNTLSAGDRATLALAFFLAHLHHDPKADKKLVVFDDPFNSQDASRREMTMNKIIEVSRKCAQVIVLSHDPHFLKRVWDRLPPAERVALEITDRRAQGSIIKEGNLERACRRQTATDIEDLKTYLEKGEGQPLDIIRKLRPILETHCRTTWPGHFNNNDNLGKIIRKIREGGENHPGKAFCEDLCAINDYTKPYHHGENRADDAHDRIDRTELSGFIKLVLRIVGTR